MSRYVRFPSRVRRGIADVLAYSDSALRSAGSRIAENFRQSPGGTMIGEGIEAAAGLATGKYRHKPSGIMPALDRAADRLTASTTDPTKLPMMLHGGTVDVRWANELKQVMSEGLRRNGLWEMAEKVKGLEPEEAQTYFDVLERLGLLFTKK